MSTEMFAWWHDFHFLRPPWLALLVPLAWLCWRLKRRTGSREVLARFCDLALLPHLTVSLGRTAGGRLLPFALAGVLAILALAGPTVQRMPQPVYREQQALVVLLDLSRSMNAQDVLPSRLERARYKIRDLLAARRRGQTALVVYTERAFVVTPLTDDVNTIVSQLSVMEPSLMPSQGTNAAAAVEQALALLAQAGSPVGDLLMVTDDIPGPQRARLKELLRGRDVRLCILGAGTAAGAPIPDDDGGFIKDGNGRIVVARFDAQALAAVARSAGGSYATLSPDSRDVDALSGFLEARTLGEVATAARRQTEQWQELGPWLLLPVVFIASLAFRRGLLMCALLPVLAAPRPAQAIDWWFTPDQRAQHDFAHEQYAKAAAAYADPAWRGAAHYRAGDYAAAAQALDGSHDADDLYNRGNAFARQGKFDEALAAYDAALKAAPGLDDAKYNKSLIEDMLRQQQQDRSQQDQQQQDQQQQQQSDDAPHNEAGGENGQGQGENARDGSAATRESEMTPPSESGEEASRERESDAGQSAQSRESRRQQAAGSAGNAASDEAEAADAERAQARHDAEGDREEENAAEQWLRQVPDDPGGLWRRKFRYQYQRQYGGQSGSAEPW